MGSRDEGHAAYWVVQEGRSAKGFLGGREGTAGAEGLRGEKERGGGKETSGKRARADM